MKPFSNVVEYYYNTLHKEVEKLEKKRQKIGFRVVLYSLFALLITVVALSLLYKNTKTFELEYIFFAGAFLAAVYGIIYKFLTKDYALEFKYKVIKPLVEHIDSNLRYSVVGMVAESSFKEAKVTTQTIDRYQGDDYVSGIINGVKLSFCDLLVEKKEEHSKTNNTYVTLFQGIFLESEFPKHFHSKTYVYPDKLAKAFGSQIGDFLQSNPFGSAKLLKLDNPEFEHYFKVYGESAIEARYILSHSLMQKIVHFRKKVAHDITLSFVGGRFYLAIAYNKPSLEAAVFNSLLDYKVAKEYIETLYFAISVVEELALNKKLWSKI